MRDFSEFSRDLGSRLERVRALGRVLKVYARDSIRDFCLLCEALGPSTSRPSLAGWSGCEVSAIIWIFQRFVIGSREPIRASALETANGLLDEFSYWLGRVRLFCRFVIGNEIH